jgi:hypothetical protein
MNRIHLTCTLTFFKKFFISESGKYLLVLLKTDDFKSVEHSLIFKAGLPEP